MKFFFSSYFCCLLFVGSGGIEKNIFFFVSKNRNIFWKFPEKKENYFFLFPMEDWVGVTGLL
jgi:hypothetical protein